MEHGFKVSYSFKNIYFIKQYFSYFSGSTPYPGMGAREVMRRVRDGYRSVHTY